MVLVHNPGMVRHLRRVADHHPHHTRNFGTFKHRPEAKTEDEHVNYNVHFERTTSTGVASHNAVAAGSRRGFDDIITGVQPQGSNADLFLLRGTDIPHAGSRHVIIEAILRTPYRVPNSVH